MLPIWVQVAVALGNLAYQGFRLWIDYRDKIKAEDIKQCALAFEKARKKGDLNEIDQIIKDMKEKNKCE